MTRSIHGLGRPSPRTLLFCLFLTFLYADSAIAQDYVQPCGRYFVHRGWRFRFVGCNILGLCHYGEGDLFPSSESRDRVTNIESARNVGFKVIRVFAANKYATPSQVAQRLRTVLDLAHQNNVYIIPALTDLYSAHGTYPQGDEQYYGGNWSILQPAWYQGGFENNYWPMVQQVVTELRNHPALFAWEIGNELEGSFDPNYFVVFMNEIRTRIRAIDPNHMITTGLLSTDHGNISPYSDLALDLYRDFDFVTWHRYNEDDWRHQEIIAERLGKPLVIEEVGFHRDYEQYNEPSEAEAALNRDIQQWLVNGGAAGYVHWQFQAVTRFIGDTDGSYGIDHRSNDDR